MQTVEHLFERFFWASGLLTLVAVLASLVLAVVMFYIATVDVVLLAKDVTHEMLADDVRRHTHASIVAHVAEIVDG